ncbi:MAG: hypothetical protein J0G97_19990, partial [Rhizobium pusense]|nr:hypothetical protein [Agrobacterium pusense]
IALVAERLGGLDLQLAGARIAVEKERLLFDVGLCRVGGRVVLIVRGHVFHRRIWFYFGPLNTTNFPVVQPLFTGVLCKCGHGLFAFS